MYLNSYLAVKEALTQVLPENTAWYLESVPGSMTLPALYMEHLASSAERLGAGTVQGQIQWKIVYFPSQLPDGRPDSLEQLTVMDRIRDTMMSKPALEQASGQSFDIMEFAGGSGESGMFAAVRLQSQYGLTSEAGEYERMGKLHVSRI